MAEIVTPPSLHRGRFLPVLFLAGPIQGANDWQAEAIEILEKTPDVLIASPRRPSIAIQGDFIGKDYTEQVDWEHYYLDLARKYGVTMFWLAKEARHDCSRAYAQTTRFELGEAMVNNRMDGARLVVGIEEGFTNARYISYTLKKKAPSAFICSSLAETCQAAAYLLRQCPLSGAF